MKSLIILVSAAAITLTLPVTTMAQRMRSNQPHPEQRIKFFKHLRHKFHLHNSTQHANFPNQTVKTRPKQLILDTQKTTQNTDTTESSEQQSCEKEIKKINYANTHQGVSTLQQEYPTQCQKYAKSSQTTNK